MTGGAEAQERDLYELQCALNIVVMSQGGGREGYYEEARDVTQHSRTSWGPRSMQERTNSLTRFEQVAEGMQSEMPAAAMASLPGNHEPFIGANALPSWSLCLPACPMCTSTDWWAPHFSLLLGRPAPSPYSWLSPQ